MKKKMKKAKKKLKRKWIIPPWFKLLSSEELSEILGLTIKKDDANKLIIFLCMLSAFTEQSQFNVASIAPSSSGKTYIPLELSPLFPDVKELGYCSPAAFYHDEGEYIKEENTIEIDLSRRILIFLDQPHSLLLQRLRSLLSHDRKVIDSKITDKSEQGGNRTKNIRFIGYPAVIFCSTGTRLDEQETTRLILLSPDMNQEKLRQGVWERIKRESDRDSYTQSLNKNRGRKLLKWRIKAIKKANIKEINIAKPEKIKKRFLAKHKILKPRHQRDIGHLMSLVKAFALLNFWFRKKIGNTIIANDQDIDEAFKLWDKISESQEHGLPPYIYRFYKEIILPAHKEKNPNQRMNIGLTKKDISTKHYQVYKRMIDDWTLRQQILPALEIAGLIKQETDPIDKRRILIYPLLQNEKE